MTSSWLTTHGGESNSRSIDWVEAMRKFANEGSFAKYSLNHVELCSGELPLFSAALKEDAVALCLMLIPVDGDPPPVTTEEDSVVMDWDDDPEPDS